MDSIAKWEVTKDKDGIKHSHLEIQRGCYLAFVHNEDGEEIVDRFAYLIAGDKVSIEDK